MADEIPTLVGIDHAFSFPENYFERHGRKRDWPAFLDDFQRHWPTDQANASVSDCQAGACGDARKRSGDPRWLRLTEMASRSVGGQPKPVFRFGIPGNVATSTHAGLPWLRWLRRELRGRVHFWPFDGWTPRPGRSVIAEVYPALWNKGIRLASFTQDQHDARCVALTLRRADTDGTLSGLFSPNLSDDAQALGRYEGWILGVPGDGSVAPQPRQRAADDGQSLRLAEKVAARALKDAPIRRERELDSQLVELAGRYWLTSELLRASVEVAIPERDRGIDLIAYFDLGDTKFVARPIQMIAASRAAFSLYPKYEKFPDLLLVYIWNLGETSGIRSFALTYGEALGVATRMDWTKTDSWRHGGSTGKRGYFMSNPSQRLQHELAAFEMHRDRWPATIAGRRE
ncbi:MAG: hypothetical protein ACRD1L_07970 [Terriglobales bacterium]